MFWRGLVAVPLVGCYTTSTFTISGGPVKKANLKDTLKVMTYNIANARGNTIDFFKTFLDSRDVKRNLDAIVRCAMKNNVDVLALQEVDFDSIRTCNIDQGRYIAEKLGFNYVSEEKYFHIASFLSLGNAVISKYPITHVKSHNFGSNLGERIENVFKGFLDVDLHLPDRDLGFIVTHLHMADSDKRVEQVIQILRYLKNKDKDFILAGDFNASYGTRCIKLLEESGLFNMVEIKRKIPSYPSDKPIHSIDHILPSSSFEMFDYKYELCDASDHAPVIANIVL